jgi:hypothetical protein
MWGEQAICYLQVDFRSICAIDKLTNERRKVTFVFEHTKSLLASKTHHQGSYAKSGA